MVSTYDDNIISTLSMFHSPGAALLHLLRQSMCNCDLVQGHTGHHLRPSDDTSAWDSCRMSHCAGQCSLLGYHL